MKLDERESTQCLGKYSFTCQHLLHRHKLISARAAHNQTAKTDQKQSKLSRKAPKLDLLFLF